MLQATIVKEKPHPKRDRPVFHVRIDTTPQTGGDVEVIEILGQKAGETRESLERRADDFLRDYAVMYG